MIIVMQPNAQSQQIQLVIQHVEELGFQTIINEGEMMTVIAAIGDKRLVDVHTLEALDGVREIVPITEPFKQASRQVKPEDTVIRFDNGVCIGGDGPAVIMAGPCSVEANPIFCYAQRKPLKKQGQPSCVVVRLSPVRALMISRVLKKKA